MKPVSAPRTAPSELSLSVNRQARPDQAVLMSFALAKHKAAGHSEVGLVWLGGDLNTEFWQVPGALSASGQTGDVLWRRAGGLLYLECVLPDDGRLDPAAIAEPAYLGLLEQAKQNACPRLLRAWNYLPSINVGDGDDERYRRFCIGRSRAFDRVGIDASDLCAGTTIGGGDPHLRIMLLCANEPGIHIENPRQLSAYRYPRIYGPRSPSFARATGLPMADGSVLLMISGTASVVGHETLHAGDLEAQIEEIRLNLEALLVESSRRLGRTGVAGFDDTSLVRVYVRHAEHWPQVEACLRECWPKVPLAGLRGDVCRSDLLIEIEAVLTI